MKTTADTLDYMNMLLAKVPSSKVQTTQPATAGRQINIVFRRATPADAEKGAH